MKNQDQYEREVQARSALSSNFAVPIACTSADFEGQWKADAERLFGLPQYPHGIIMEQGEQNLMVALLQEKLTIYAPDPRQNFRTVMLRVVECISHLHELGLIHAVNVIDNVLLCECDEQFSHLLISCDRT